MSKRAADLVSAETDLCDTDEPESANASADRPTVKEHHKSSEPVEANEPPIVPIVEPATHASLAVVRAAGRDPELLVLLTNTAVLGKKDMKKRRVDTASCAEPTHDTQSFAEPIATSRNNKGGKVWPFSSFEWLCTFTC